MVMAAIKLRQRNLGPLLDANSWAVNTRAKLNFALGATLTKPAKLPANSRRIIAPDPFENKSNKNQIIVGIVAVCVFVLAAYFIWTGKNKKEKVVAPQQAQVETTNVATKAEVSMEKPASMNPEGK